MRQKFEIAELVGFETRNKYVIETEQGAVIGFAAEQQKGILGFLFRQFLGHWRTFEITFFDQERQPVLVARHPFRWWFQRLEVRTPEGEYLGALQQRFAILTKKFDVEGPLRECLMAVRSPIWKIWTFPFIQNGQEVALIQKKWSGLLTEMMTDKDRFRV